MLHLQMLLEPIYILKQHSEAKQTRLNSKSAAAAAEPEPWSLTQARRRHMPPACMQTTSSGVTASIYYVPEELKQDINGVVPK